MQMCGRRNVWGLYMSLRFWRESGMELAHPRAQGLPTAAIWVYRVCNALLNGLNGFWLLRMGQAASRMVLLGHKGSAVSAGKDD
jgi:hypothetical protein